jgi:hypothetical protein
MRKEAEMNRRTIVMFLLLGLPFSASAQVKLPPETRNAALRYWMAFAEIKDPPSDKATQELLEKTAAGEATWDEAKLGPLLEANADALGIFQRATKLPDCDWGIEYSQGPRASIAFVPRARVLARLNTLQGIREMTKGQWQQAVDTWLSGIHFAQDLTKGGSLIFVLTASSALRQEMRVLTAEAKQGHLNNTQKKQLYGAVNALPADGFDWGRAWEMEEAAGEPFFEEMQHSQNPAALYESMMGEPAPKTCVPPGVRQLRAYHEYMSAVAATLRLPPATSKQRLAELDSEAKSVCEAIRRAVPNPQKVNDTRFEIMTVRQALLQALNTK